jgi:DNA-binding NarL/FixJ family response regulator
MDSQKTKILIVEDDGIIAEDLNSLLCEKGYSVIGVAHSGVEALDMLETRKPEFAVLDINLGSGMTGLDVAKVVHEKHGIPYIFLTSFDDDDTLVQAQNFGPYGYIVKPYQERTLLTTIKTAIANFRKSQTKSTLCRDNLNDISIQKITNQEFKIIECLLEGLSYQQIAEKLFISVNTVKFHTKNIYIKLDIKGRAELYGRIL